MTNKPFEVQDSAIVLNGVPLEITEGGNLSVGGDTISGGEGLGSITVPAAIGTTYKGLQVAYGGFHSNSEVVTRNVTKVVIHKPAVASVNITGTSSSDFFEVSGLGDSDVLAMFVMVGDVNGEKPLSDIEAFAESVIDNVILEDGVQGQYRTVNEMKPAFYDNFQSLRSASGGLAEDFEFYNNFVQTLNGGVTTVREGSGAVFEIRDQGDGTYFASGIQNPGTNYQPGHKILILGTSLGGATPDNDCIITVDSVIGDTGEIFNRSVSGTAAGSVVATYGPITGTNYNVGSGFAVSSLNRYGTGSDIINLGDFGINYVVGDVITLSGANVEGGTTPENDITITVTQVDDLGRAFQYTATGTVPNIWPTDNIEDGGNDEYDDGNFINSSYLSNIDYNDGETVADGVAAFGTGSSYSFVYNAGIFGLLVTGNSSTRIGTDGDGPDSSSIIISGHIYGPSTVEQTFTNAVSHLNLVASNPYAGSLITFTRTDYGDEIDEVSEGLHITKNDAGWLYNALEDEGHGSNTPTGSRWNNDGWDNFGNVESRTYSSLSDIWSGNFANIPGAKMIMLDETTGKYWAVEFLSWTQGQQGGGASYTRQELDLDNLQQGIRFSDGTVLNSAEGLGRVKLISPGSRRIEEVSGYKQVNVTSRTTGNTITTTAFASNSGDTNRVQLSASGADRAALIALADGDVYYRIQVSLNQQDWATGYVNGWGSNDVNITFDDGVRLPVSQGDTVYYRSYTGGEPVTWWDKDELPYDSTDFRGAIIKYHAFTGDSTWIGTIHIVDDGSEEHITHTEVQSGSSDGENDDLWYVTSEGRIRYRRTDGDQHTLKIQWTATVFYGSEEN